MLREESQSMEELDNIIIKEKYGQTQRHDKGLKSIRNIAEKGREPYFCRGGLLIRKPYQNLGKILLVIPTIARQEVLSMTHYSPIAWHFGRDRALHTIRTRMDWPAVVRDLKTVGATSPLCQGIGPALTTKAPLHHCLVIKEPFTH